MYFNLIYFIRNYMMVLSTSIMTKDITLCNIIGMAVFHFKVVGLYRLAVFYVYAVYLCFFSVVELQYIASFQFACLYPAFPDHVERMPKRRLDFLSRYIDLDYPFFLVPEQLYDRL